MDNQKRKILFLTANPSDTTWLRLNRESRDIQEKLQMANKRDKFEFYEKLAVRPGDISQAFLDIKPQIVHFSGHGKETGELCFENQLGKTQTVLPSALAALFKLFSNHVDCVLLNACYSQIQAKAIVECVPFVIGMNQAIGDLAAITFAVGFYKALGAGDSIEEAYELGCVEMQLEGTGGHLTPKLYTKKKGIYIALNSDRVQSSTKDNLVSEQGINYTHLQNLLEANNWKEADLETCRIMLKISNREEKGWLNNKSIPNLPCQDLLTIDRLWAKYSSGRFGFSVQKQIWSEANENITIFGHLIGWCVNNNWRSHYSDYIFSLNAPFGHLPSLKWLSGWRLQEDVWEQEFGSIGRLMKPIFGLGNSASYLFFNDTEWEGLSTENYRAESIFVLMSRLEYCNSLHEANQKRSYFVWVFFLLFSSCLMSLFLTRA